VLVHALNSALGNVGETVRYLEPVVAPAAAGTGADSLAELVGDMAADRVDTLVILGGNPAFDGPADLPFVEALRQVPRRIYLGPYENETSEHCHWLVPESHDLESWADGRAFDGTVTLCQPLIEPLYETRTAAQLLAALLDRGEASGYDLLREHWLAAGLDEAELRRAIHDGWVRGTEAPEKTVTLIGVTAAVDRLRNSSRSEGLELVLLPDPTLHDGRFANNGWLQECPKPLTKLTWDNALLLSPATARRLEVGNEDLVKLTTATGEVLEVPVWVLPGQADGTATLHVGYGRRRGGAVGTGTGFDAYRLRTAAELWHRRGVTLEHTGRRYALACTQDHFSMDGRGQVRSADLEHYRRDPGFAQHWGHSHAPAADETFYPPYEYKGHAWGLAIDLSACTGCSACVVACQAENNIPVVGKQQVLNGREMHWIRIDRYFEGSLDDPQVHHQPVMCQHCEQAPCEVVCPVAATVHSDEGLNDMVYNRCVGTRYCSNNCPYKVRRFNFLEYNDHRTPVLKLLRNPDVTLRERGVMEKCTYCVQRINGARQDAKVRGTSIADGEIQTACQQACPSGAIRFGDLNDEGSKVREWRDRPTHYGLLAELNTRPRTGYLAKVRNPNPALTRA
jgi:molybdopterin-containing oxidoreductase family iron-sulfur binding subunit